MTIISHDVHQVEVTLDTDTVDTIAVLEAQVAHTPSRASLSWAEVEPGLWSANYGGYFGGTVDKRDGTTSCPTRSASTSGTSARWRTHSRVSPSVCTSCSRPSSARSTDRLRRTDHGHPTTRDRAQQRSTTRSMTSGTA